MELIKLFKVLPCNKSMEVVFSFKSSHSKIPLSPRVTLQGWQDRRHYLIHPFPLGFLELGDQLEVFYRKYRKHIPWVILFPLPFTIVPDMVILPSLSAINLSVMNPLFNSPLKTLRDISLAYS